MSMFPKTQGPTPLNLMGLLGDFAKRDAMGNVQFLQTAGAGPSLQEIPTCRKHQVLRKKIVD